jgi:hypothetical protein
MAKKRNTFVEDIRESLNKSFISPEGIIELEGDNFEIDSNSLGYTELSAIIQAFERHKKLFAISSNGDHSIKLWTFSRQLR